MGCDFTPAAAKNGGQDFNPRTRVGCDINGFRQAQSPINFNPRTRVGCDILMSWWKSASNDFNPRTRVGCDKGILNGIKEGFAFQSTHPRGVRRTSMPLFLGVTDFNPRTRVGCDGGLISVDTGFFYFNPRPRVGCDPRARHYDIPAMDFNPRTRVGCDNNGQPNFYKRPRFQSTHPRGVRPDILFTGEVYARISIHAPAWGATRYGKTNEHFRAFISIHAPAWGATFGSTN